MIKRHNIKNQAVLYDLIVGLQLHPVCHELDKQNCILELCKYVVKNARTRKLEHTRLLKMHNHLGLSMYHVLVCYLASSSFLNTLSYNIEQHTVYTAHQ